MWPGLLPPADGLGALPSSSTGHQTLDATQHMAPQPGNLNVVLPVAIPGFTLLPLFLPHSTSALD